MAIATRMRQLYLCASAMTPACTLQSSKFTSTLWRSCHLGVLRSCACRPASQALMTLHSILVLDQTVMTYDRTTPDCQWDHSLLKIYSFSDCLKLASRQPAAAITHMIDTDLASNEMASTIMMLCVYMHS